MMRILKAVAASWLFFCLFAGSARADLTFDDDSRFRIVFTPETSNLPENGPAAAANDEAIARVATVFQRIGGLHKLRFIFVTARPRCVPADVCDRLLWERGNHVMNAVASHLHKAGLSAPYRNLSFVFLDELKAQGAEPSWTLPPDTMTLVLDRAEIEQHPEPCQARLFLRDADLPRMISHEPGIPIGSGERASISAQSQFTVLSPSKSLRAVWADGLARLRKGDFTVADGSFHAFPKEAERLYLVAAPGQNADVTRFFEKLNDAFASSPLPQFLSEAAMQTASAGESAASGGNATDRGVGDNVQPIGPGTVIGKPSHGDAGDKEPVRVCRYEFSPSPADGLSSPAR